MELTAGAGGEADGSDIVACDLDGNPVTVALSPSRLLDAVTAIGTGRTRIALTTASKPALITPPMATARTRATAPADAHPRRRLTPSPPAPSLPATESTPRLMPRPGQHTVASPAAGGVYLN